MQMKTYRKHIGILMLVFAAVACVEQHPQLFGDIAGVYFNNRTSGVFSDERNVTFVYEDEDEVQIPVTVQLVGRPAPEDREVSITAVSDNAEEGVDYRLPERSVLPAGASSFEYIVTLLRTDAIKVNTKTITLEVHPNGNFSLPVTEMVQASGNVTTLEYRIVFSDMFTEPPVTWDKNILGDFSQQKFELICRVLDIKRSDFNDYEKMTLSFQVYIFNEMRRYIKDELAKKEAGEEYDEDIIDKVTGEPITFPSE